MLTNAAYLMWIHFDWTHSIDIAMLLEILSPGEMNNHMTNWQIDA